MDVGLLLAVEPFLEPFWLEAGFDPFTPPFAEPDGAVRGFGPGLCVSSPPGSGGRAAAAASLILARNPLPAESAAAPLRGGGASPPAGPGCLPPAASAFLRAVSSLMAFTIVGSCLYIHSCWPTRNKLETMK